MPPEVGPDKFEESHGASRMQDKPVTPSQHSPACRVQTPVADGDGDGCPLPHTLDSLCLGLWPFRPRP